MQLSPDALGDFGHTVGAHAVGAVDQQRRQSDGRCSGGGRGRVRSGRCAQRRAALERGAERARHLRVVCLERRLASRVGLAHHPVQLGRRRHAVVNHLRSERLGARNHKCAQVRRGCTRITRHEDAGVQSIHASDLCVGRQLIQTESLQDRVDSCTQFFLLCVCNLCCNALPLLCHHLSTGVDQLDSIVALLIVRRGDHHSDDRTGAGAAARRTGGGGTSCRCVRARRRGRLRSCLFACAPRSNSSQHAHAHVDAVECGGRTAKSRRAVAVGRQGARTGLGQCLHHSGDRCAQRHGDASE